MVTRKTKKKAGKKKRTSANIYQPGVKQKIPRGCYFDERAAQDAVDFIQALKHTKGKWAGQPFILLPWQLAIVRDIFGWKRPNGKRLYKKVYIEIPKKNGKSELGAAIALYLLFGDGEAGAEVYSAAADKDQAKIVFDVAKDMFEMEPALQYDRDGNLRGKRIPSTYRIVNYELGGFYRALSSEVAGKHGYNVHGVIFDELHAQPDRRLYDVMTYGSGDAREQPLFIFLTTAGIDRNSICWEVHEYARQVIAGIIEDPEFYAVFFGLSDEEDQADPEAWGREETWRRCNPSLEVIVPLEIVAKEYRDALNNPFLENQFRQMRLNQWVKSNIKPIPLRDWDACAGVVHKDKLLHKVCYGGLDLASKIDMAALALIFPDDKQPPGYDLLLRYWIPSDNIRDPHNKNRELYLKWEKKELVTATPGNVIDYDYILDELDGMRLDYELQELAYDPFGSWEIIQELQKRGFVLEEKAAGYGHPLLVTFRQGWKTMSAPTKDFIAMVVDRQNRGRFRHGGNPVLRWNVDNLVLWQDKAGNVTPDKAKSSEKIDGVVASIMALDRALKHQGPGKSVYEEHGLDSIDL